jgi:hypothetical protein
MRVLWCGMTDETIINEDLCATCSHCSLLRPTGPAPWEAPAVCAAGWPWTKTFHNIRSECPRYQLKDQK